MTGIPNPVLSGFDPDPSILRVGSSYYLATSTFEWLPAVRIHRSEDLNHWELIGHAVTGDQLGMRGLPASTGVWAPCLTRHPATGRFYLVFSVMKSQVAEVFDVENLLVWADDMEGPWSDPVFLNGVGFDPSLFHDEDGTTWLTTLEWETREGREHPGWIVAQRVDLETLTVGPPQRIHHGSTDRGAMEAPHLYHHDGWYYLMTAEGGTGYGHGVCLARSRTLLGPYAADPIGPFITSWPAPYFGRNNRDFLRPEYHNPDAPLQKAGHGSLVEGETGDWYVAHLSSRPLPGTKASVLGRETSIQRVEWHEGWLRLVGGGTLARAQFDVPGEIEGHERALDVSTDFRSGVPMAFSSLRDPASGQWCSTGPRGLELKGRDSLSSVFDVSLLATRLRAFSAVATTKVDFQPDHFSQTAGLTLFYDNRNFSYLRITWDEVCQSRMLGVVHLRTGQKTEFPLAEIAIDDGEVTLRADIRLGGLQFSAKLGGQWVRIGPELDVTGLSDDVIGGFTGTFVGIACSDGLSRSRAATFGHFSLIHDR
ncbi:xylan 1,4-beta-xylosidase [Tessaracoccus bendigoensis DSM 12906]|uniref:Xylan 1,4-beta-xylosidase n=1 Tax=Tessaracoccus bendigoensis DSM 12906 TaxID=1123357 RepID=A0A1M6C7T5_9ACTN|nr:glycoside hydrolase family 43 protein [Tessaracoccus bendigoensis]SHI57052.1 xylan 1,4-beta-xylosidase [Tessaracoccus bendigoensis DSM 12906]